MKLRNKKTGEIWDIGKIITNDNPSYDTLESIVKDFVDYKQPLIKDPRILNSAIEGLENGVKYTIIDLCGDSDND